MVSMGTEEPAAIVTKLRQALAAADRLSSERAALEEALKARVLLPLSAGSPPTVMGAPPPLQTQKVAAWLVPE